MIDELSVLSGQSQSVITTVNSGLTEFQQTYAERQPYSSKKDIQGTCYIWSEVFIELARYAMSTDDLSEMSTQEKEAWFRFENYEDSEQVEDELAMEALDDIFVSILNCEEYNTCGTLKELTDITCP
jgi:hypothetical protein